MDNNTLLASLVEEALAKGLPMPLNWCVYEDLSDSYSYDDDDESDWDDYSDDYSDYEESEQAEDDPEDKEVRDDCDSQTTEDCHGGNEATRSIEDSPSVAENGQEDRDSDQTEDGGDDGDGEGEDGQPGETTHSYENGQNSGEDGSGSGEGEEGTSPDSDGGQGGSGDGKTSIREHADEEENQSTSEDNGNGSTNTELVTALLTALQQKKERADAKAERERAFREDPEMTNWIEAEKKITSTIIHICERDCGRIKNAPTSWDTRAMSRDVAIGRWDHVLRDKKWSHRTKNLVIFWDQSGSCDRYISAVRNALKTVAELGYRCTLFDASNGINTTYSVVWHKTKPNQTTEDRYQNGPRLKEVAKDIGAKTDSNTICPNITDFINICEKADVVIVLQDYDCVEPLFTAASKVSRRKCPHFIDLETRYDEPYEHNWNPGMCQGQKYTVPDRWYRIWDTRGEEY